MHLFYFKLLSGDINAENGKWLKFGLTPLFGQNIFVSGQTRSLFNVKFTLPSGSLIVFGM